MENTTGSCVYMYSTAPAGNALKCTLSALR